MILSNCIEQKSQALRKMAALGVLPVEVEDYLEIVVYFSLEVSNANEEGK